mgnify:CR=1 FL=1
MSPSSLILMKRIFLTLGLLLFAGGSYYIGENYTLVQLSPEQIAQMNTTGIQSSVLVSGSETSE